MVAPAQRRRTRCRIPAAPRLPRRRRVVTYGPHVTPTPPRHGARRVRERPQAVDAAFWSGGPAAPRARRDFQVLFVGRPEPGEGRPGAHTGLERLRPRMHPSRAGAGRRWPRPARPPPARPIRADVGAEEVRNFYAAADVLVIPSLADARPSASRGGWSSTRPCTRDSRHRNRRRWAPPPAGSSARAQRARRAGRRRGGAGGGDSAPARRSGAAGAACAPRARRRACPTPSEAWARGHAPRPVADAVR